MHVRTSNIVFMIALLVSVLSYQSYSQPEPNDERNLPPNFHKVLKEKLHLTADQEKQTKAVRMKFAKEGIQLRAALQTKQLEIKQIMDSDNPDRALLEKNFREIGEIQVRQKLMAFDQRMEMKKILTPEQQKIAKELLESAPRMERPDMQGRRGMRGGGMWMR